MEKKNPTSEELLQHLGLIRAWRVFLLKPEDTGDDIRCTFCLAVSAMTEYKGQMVKGLPACAAKNARPFGKRKGFSVVGAPSAQDKKGP